MNQRGSEQEEIVDIPRSEYPSPEGAKIKLHLAENVFDKEKNIAQGKSKNIISILRDYWKLGLIAFVAISALFIFLYGVKFSKSDPLNPVMCPSKTHSKVTPGSKKEVVYKPIDLASSNQTTATTKTLKAQNFGVISGLKAKPVLFTGVLLFVLLVIGIYCYLNQPLEDSLTVVNSVLAPNNLTPVDLGIENLVAPNCIEGDETQENIFLRGFWNNIYWIVAGVLLLLVLFLLLLFMARGQRPNSSTTQGPKVTACEFRKEQLQEKQRPKEQLQEKQLRKEQLQEKQRPKEQPQEEQLPKEQPQEEQPRKEQLQEEQLPKEQPQDEQPRKEQPQEEQLPKEQPQEKQRPKEQPQEEQLPKEQPQDEQPRKEQPQEEQLPKEQPQEKQRPKEQPQEEQLPKVELPTVKSLNIPSSTQTMELAVEKLSPIFTSQSWNLPWYIGVASKEKETLTLTFSKKLNTGGFVEYVLDQKCQYIENLQTSFESSPSSKILTVYIQFNNSLMPFSKVSSIGKFPKEIKSEEEVLQSNDGKWFRLRGCWETKEPELMSAVFTVTTGRLIEEPRFVENRDLQCTEHLEKRPPLEQDMSRLEYKSSFELNFVRRPHGQTLYILKNRLPNYVEKLEHKIDVENDLLIVDFIFKDKYCPYTDGTNGPKMLYKMKEYNPENLGVVYAINADKGNFKMVWELGDRIKEEKFTLSIRLGIKRPEDYVWSEDKWIDCET